MMKYLLELWKGHYRPYLLMLLCTLMLACSALVVSSEQTQVQQARSADSFVNSIGVAVHLNYNDTAYAKYNDIIKPRLQEIGIRHIRGGVALKDRKTLKKFNDLAELGIHSTIVMDPRRVSNSKEALEIAKILNNSIEAVEGPNEWDSHPQLKYKGEGFPEGVRKYQAELYKAIKKDPETSHLAVLGPSIARANKASKLGKVACDIGTMHSYAGGKIPSWNLNSKWITSARAICGDKSIIATESGYHNAINKTEAKVQPGVTEQAASKYIPRSFLEHYNWGIRRVYDYELIDLMPNPKADNKKFNFGLLRSDGSQKPAFNAVKNLIILLKEDTASEAFSPNSLHYGLRGDTSNVHRTLLQKQDGSFYLILWQELPSFDLKTKKDISVPARTIQLILNSQVKQATTYLPNNSLIPIKDYNNPRQIELTILDHPLVIKMMPK